MLEIKNTFLCVFHTISVGVQVSLSTFRSIFNETVANKLYEILNQKYDGYLAIFQWKVSLQALKKNPWYYVKRSKIATQQNNIQTNFF